jgi:hypothetical protein
MDSKQSSNEKGKYLEDAVEIIERLIISQNPALSLSVITIERRKIVIESGVKHEIDLYIKADPGNSYDSVYIFECKDWEKVVGKNEIIVFKRKIDVTKAQKGFFIANSFSKDAIAEAALDKRIELVDFKKGSNFEELFQIPIIPQRFLNTTAIHVNARKTKNSTDKEEKIDVSSAILKHKGEIVNMKDFFTKIAQEAAWEKVNTERPQNFDLDKKHELKTIKELEFTEGELLIDDKNVGYLEVHTSFTFQISHPKILTVYDISKRGRTARLIYEIPDGQGTVELGLAQI